MDDSMQRALNDLFRAQAEFKRCEAIVALKLESDAALDECLKKVGASIDDLLQSSCMRKHFKVEPCEKEADEPYRPPSWTLNESLDAENAKVFKRQCVGNK